MSQWDKWSERDLECNHVGAEFLSKFVELEADVLPVWVLANCHAVSPNEGQ